ncbi:mitochondrial import receptor subunit TOM6 homolog [Hyperolius riggenbachi]|uniref:mitochondrial import receptor subunit TOM6 homolog n=1 Tax=Hyperolius riggenbachi TaxID=752182 RepID=UPI0035A37E6D
MAAGNVERAAGSPSFGGYRNWFRGMYRFATDKNDFRRNLLVNLGLFGIGVWVARNMSDIDLTTPQPGV